MIQGLARLVHDGRRSCAAPAHERDLLDQRLPRALPPPAVLGTRGSGHPLFWAPAVLGAGAPRGGRRGLPPARDRGARLVGGLNPRTWCPVAPPASSRRSRASSGPSYRPLRAGAPPATPA